MGRDSALYISFAAKPVHKARLLPACKDIVGKNQWIGQY